MSMKSKFFKVFVLAILVLISSFFFFNGNTVYAQSTCRTYVDQSSDFCSQSPEYFLTCNYGSTCLEGAGAATYDNRTPPDFCGNKAKCSPVGGVCGTANGQNLLTAPTSPSLCSVGTASTVSGTGPWSWTCGGYYGGAPASCSANKTPTTCTMWFTYSPTTVPYNGSTTYNYGGTNVNASTVQYSFDGKPYAAISFPGGPTTQSNLTSVGSHTITIKGQSPGGLNCSASAGYTVSPVSPAPVNGGWSAWSPASCPTACGQPASTLNRTCTNPAPSNGGKLCTDSTNPNDNGTNASQSCSATAVCSVLGADLTASAPAPSTATANVALTFSSTISNIGTASTGAGFSNFFQKATAANGGGTITNLASSAMSALSAGGNGIATSPSIIFSTAGTYSIRACADKTSSAGGGVITESNENNNCSRWVDVVVIGIPPSCTNISATDCGIPGGESTCGSILNWGTKNLTSGDTAVTRNNPDNSHVAPPISPTTSGTNVRNTVNYGLTGRSTFFVYHNIDGTPTKLCQVIMTARCDSGSTWNGSMCNPIPGLSGTLTPEKPSCDIPEDKSSCKIKFTWETKGAVPGGTISGVRSDVNDFGTPWSDFHVSVPDANSDSKDFVIPYDIRTFYLYNTRELATSTVTSKCSTSPVNTTWDSIKKKCVKVIINTCQDGTASNYGGPLPCTGGGNPGGGNPGGGNPGGGNGVGPGGHQCGNLLCTYYLDSNGNMICFNGNSNPPSCIKPIYKEN